MRLVEKRLVGKRLRPVTERQTERQTERDGMGRWAGDGDCKVNYCIHLTT